MRYDDDESWMATEVEAVGSGSIDDREEVGWGPGRERGVPFPCQEDITGGRYLAIVYVDAGEGVICWHKPGRRDVESRISASGKLRLLVDKGTGEIVETDFVESADERERKNLLRADRRARHEARLYCVRNRLSKMWTLTLAEIIPKEEVKKHVNRLMRQWRDLNGGKEFPYLYVLELHADGERWHVHVAVPKGYTDKRRLQALWSLGIIRFDDSPWASRRGISGRERARRLAAYLCKYISKGMGDSHVAREHRYERAQGFAVERVRRAFAMQDNAEAWLMDWGNETWRLAWSSNEIDGWDAPPVWGYLSG